MVLPRHPSHQLFEERLLLPEFQGLNFRAAMEALADALRQGLIPARPKQAQRGARDVVIECRLAQLGAHLLEQISRLADREF